MIMKLYFRSNDLEGQLWQQRTADTLRRALGCLHGLDGEMTALGVADGRGLGSGGSTNCRAYFIGRCTDRGPPGRRRNLGPGGGPALLAAGRW